MTIDRIHHEIRLRWDNLNSNHKASFPPAYLDDVINQVQTDYVELFFKGIPNGLYNVGFEVTQQRMDMLSSLVVSKKAITPTLISSGSINTYQINLSLTPKYAHLIRAEVQTSCRIPVTIVRHNDLDEKLKNTNTKPSTKWKRALATFSGTGLVLYTEGVATNFYIDYIKQPTRVFSGNYDSLERLNGDTSAPSTSSPKVTSELPEHYHNLLIDMVVQRLAQILVDGPKSQISTEKIITQV